METTQDSGRKLALVALAGQPNTGKSTIFNMLTGMHQHVGNWPGKTVEKRQGFFQTTQLNVNIVDLPGTYSLMANSPEEVVAREFIINEVPDILIAVVNASSLEKCLYLVSELIALPPPVIVALNMMDIAETEGTKINIIALENYLGIPVIPIVASDATGKNDLIKIIEELFVIDQKIQPHIPEINLKHPEIHQEITGLIKNSIPASYPLEWTAIKLLEGDPEITDIVKKGMNQGEWEKLNEILLHHENEFLGIISSRYQWIEKTIQASVIQSMPGVIRVTDRLDRLTTHPVAGLVILGLVLGFIFTLTNTIGSALQEWLDTSVLLRFTGIVDSWMVSSPGWLRGIVVDGILGGAGSVLTFFPILVIFFVSFGVLEDMGYMARAAFIMDNFMHKMGLHGKSFLPLFLGFGCNVPAIMGTRVIESWPARLLTILLAPLVPCTARMAVMAFLAPVFFGKNAVIVSISLIAVSIILLFLSGVLLNKLVFKGENTTFVMELPLYHTPNIRTISLQVWHRLLSFIKKAGTTILLLSIIVWILAYFPGGDLDSSILAAFGRWIEPAGLWIGLDWRLTTALLTSFIAKENSIATLGVLFGNSGDAGLSHLLSSTYSAATGISFMVVSLLFIPCAASVAVIKQETGSWKWTIFNIIFMLVISLFAAWVSFTIMKFWGI